MSNSHARKAGRIAIAFLSVALFQVVGCAKPPEAAPDPRLAQQEAAEKMEALSAAGVHVVKSPADMGARMRQALGA